MNRCLVWAPLSLTVTLTLNVPEADGVPAITPPVLHDRPAGRALAFHEYGVVPPDALSVAEYPPPTWPEGNAAVLITNGGGPAGLIVRLSDFWAVSEAESVTVTFTLNVPEADGVPLIVPLALHESPPGRPVAPHV